MRTNRTISTVALLFVFAVTAPAVISQTTPMKKTVSTNQATPQPNTSKPNGITHASPGQAEYNIGLLVKKIATLESHVAALQKQNAVLASEIAALQKQSDTQNTQLKGVHSQQTAEISNTNSKLQKFELRLNQLDASQSALNSSYQSHKHYMPAFGQQALSAIPGMQDIANKVGVGYVKPQWENMRILFLGQYSNGIDVTGPIYKQ